MDEYPYDKLRKHVYERVEGFIIDLGYSQENVKGATPDIIKDVKNEFPWTQVAWEGQTEEEPLARGQKVREIVYGAIDEAIADNCKPKPHIFDDDEDGVLPTGPDIDHFGFATPTAMLRQFMMHYDYVPPVDQLALISKVQPSSKTAFYNSIQYLRDNGWVIKSVGRGEGYRVVGRPEGAGKQIQHVQESVEMLAGNKEALDGLVEYVNRYIVQDPANEEEAAG